MAGPILPDDLWGMIAPFLPPPRPRPQGGRPPVANRAALTVILFVLRSGIPWELLPAVMGCGAGMRCWRRSRDWRRGVGARLHRVLLERSQGADRINWSRAADQPYQPLGRDHHVALAIALADNADGAAVESNNVCQNCL